MGTWIFKDVCWPWVIHNELGQGRSGDLKQGWNVWAGTWISIQSLFQLLCSCLSVRANCHHCERRHIIIVLYVIVIPHSFFFHSAFVVLKCTHQQWLSAISFIPFFELSPFFAQCDPPWPILWRMIGRSVRYPTSYFNLGDLGDLITWIFLRLVHQRTSAD